LPQEKRSALANAQAARVCRWLDEAAAGDAAEVRKTLARPVFDPLRKREDFQKVLDKVSPG